MVSSPIKVTSPQTLELGFSTPPQNSVALLSSIPETGPRPPKVAKAGLTGERGGGHPPIPTVRPKPGLESTLAVLEALACAGLTVLLTLDLAVVAGQEAGLLQRTAAFRIFRRERAGDA